MFCHYLLAQLPAASANFCFGEVEELSHFFSLLPQQPTNSFDINQLLFKKCQPDLSSKNCGSEKNNFPDGFSSLSEFVELLANQICALLLPFLMRLLCKARTISCA